MKQRRIAIALVFSAALLPAAAWPAAAAPRQVACSPGTQVNTQSGPVCGFSAEAPNGKYVDHYLGIRYAAPPLVTDPQACGGGQPSPQCLRWKKPVAPASWTTPVQATAFGAACAQPDANGNLLAGTSEDCLFLNVYKPSSAVSGYPVMVFIHGGAFFEGTSSTLLFDGGELATSAAVAGVIVVDFNYRLGALGFLVAPDAIPANSLTGNYGFLDQQFALEWVKNNIAAFGGDPSKVTIFGQSAGAMSVGLHMVSAPGSRGLFRAGIMESNPLGAPYQTATEAKATGVTFAAGFPTCQPNDVQCLYRQSTASLIEQQANMVGLPITQGLLWAPVIDARTVVEQPLKAWANLRNPAIFGTNLNEGTFFAYNLIPFPIPGKSWSPVLDLLFPEKVVAQRVDLVYPCADSVTDCRPVLAQLLTDFEFTCANRHAAWLGTGAAQYGYQFQALSGFNWPPPGCTPPCPCATAVCHSAELPYVFDTPGLIDGCGQNGTSPCSFDTGQGQLSQSIESYWTSFAQGPAPFGPVGWPAWGPSKQYLFLNASSSAQQITVSGSDPFASTCSFWESTGLYGPRIPATAEPVKDKWGKKKGP